MSKAFVIKNKEGKYFCGFDGFAGINIFSERIIDGLNTQTPTLKHCREEIKDFDLKDCQVVEITIAETKDLEKDFVSRNFHDVVVENYKIALNDFGNEQTVNENLLQQLADKDVKIEVLERDVENLHRTLEEANEEFAEKDKEIEELKTEVIRWEEHYNNARMDYQCLEELKNEEISELRNRLNMNDKQIRHQVCQEIREKVDNIVWNDAETVYNEINDFLDQITGE